MAMVCLNRVFKPVLILFVLLFSFSNLGVCQINYTRNCNIYYDKITLKKCKKYFKIDNGIKLVPLEEELPSILIDSCILSNEDIYFNVYLEFIPTRIKDESFIFYILEKKSNTKYKIIEVRSINKRKKYNIKLEHFSNKTIAFKVDSDYYSFRFK